MEQRVGRRRVAVAYMSLPGLATLLVVLQGFLFSGFYAEAEKGFIDAHGIVGDITGVVLVFVLIPLGFLAGFPRRLRIGWWTVLLAVLWNVQAHVLGYGIEGARWLVVLHIPTAFGILFLALYLTVRAKSGLRA